MWHVLNLSIWGMGVTVAIFIVAEQVLSFIGYKLHIRKHPY
jgi:uncharacterized membrane protein